MGSFLWLILSSIASIFVAKALGGTIEHSKAITMQAIARVSRYILKQVAWLTVGISFFVTGFILSAIEAAQVWGVEFTATLGVKMGLVVLGGCCMAVGLLMRPKGKELESFMSADQPRQQGVDWNEIIQQVPASFTKQPAAGAPTYASGETFRGDLSNADLDRIVAALKAANESDSVRRSRGPDLTQH